MNTLLRVRYQIARRLRGIGRFVLFHLVETEYHPYDPEAITVWDGCYEWNNRCLGFRDTDDRMFYSW